MMATLMTIYLWVFGVIAPVVGMVYVLYWSLELSDHVIKGLLGLFAYLLVGLPIYYTAMFFFGEIIFG